MLRLRYAIVKFAKHVFCGIIHSPSSSFGDIIYDCLYWRFFSHLLAELVTLVALTLLTRIPFFLPPSLPPAILPFLPFILSASLIAYFLSSFFFFIFFLIRVFLGTDKKKIIERLRYEVRTVRLSPDPRNVLTEPTPTRRLRRTS